MEQYTAEMRHSAETVRRFTLVQYNTFEWWRKILLLAVSAGLILFGAVYGPSSGSSALMILSIFIGCILFTNLNFRANTIADQVSEAMHGNFPTLQFSFTETGFQDGPKREAVPYEKLFCLLHDEDYLYLFISKASGYMIRKDSVKGEGETQGLMELISRKTGLPWQKPFSLLTFSIRDLLPRKKR